MNAMDTETIERTETDEQVDDGTDGDAPKMFHYVKKNKIAESAVMGTMVEALCGEVFPVTKTPKPGSPVCPACKEIFESLPKGA
jgi:formylmethanofuran dehydrogenase subunit E